MFQRPYRIILSNQTNETFSPKCRSNASIDNLGRFSLHAQILNVIKHPFMHQAIFFESDDGRYDMELINRTVDLCKFYKNKRYEPILQVIFKLFENYFTHWLTSCPMYKVKIILINK